MTTMSSRSMCCLLFHQWSPFLTCSRQLSTHLASGTSLFIFSLLLWVHYSLSFCRFKFSAVMLYYISMSRCHHVVSTSLTQGHPSVRLCCSLKTKLASPFPIVHAGLCTLLKCPRGGNRDGTKLLPIRCGFVPCHIASPRKHFVSISRICPGKTTPV